MSGQARVVIIGFAFIAAGVALWWITRGAPAPDADPSSPAPQVPAPRPPAAGVVASVELEPAPAARSQPASTPMGTGRIEVFVLDQRAYPAAHANLLAEWITWEPDEPAPRDALRMHVSTDAQGEHTFTDLPAGSWVVRAWSESGAQSEQVWVMDGEAARAELKLIDAAPTGGMVVDEAGAPVDGAVIHLYESSLYPNMKLATARATSARQYSDGEGRFLFPMLYTGTWRFHVAADGFAPLVSDWAQAGARDLRYVLGRGASVRGQVIDDAMETPIAGLPVRLVSDYERDHFVGTTDERGHFEIPSVREGAFRLAPDDDKRVAAGEVKVDVIAGQDVEGVTLRVMSGAVVAGRVYNRDTGQGVAGAQIHLSGSAIRRPRQATTDTAGRYSFAGLPAGVTRLMLQQAPGYGLPREVRSLSLDVSPPERHENQDFALSKGLAISGRILTKTDEPIAGAFIGANNPDLGTDTASGEDGSFSVSGFPRAGVVQLVIQHADYARREMTLELPDSGVEDLMIRLAPEATISGVVLTSQNTPVPNLDVIARKTNDSSGHGGTTDHTGNFLLERLEPGEYGIRIRQDGGYVVSGDGPVARVRVAEGEHKTGVRIVLEEPHEWELRGRVTNSRAEPIDGAILSGVGNSEVNSRTGGDGRFEVTLRVASATLAIGHPRYTSIVRTFTQDESNVEVVLLGRGAIEGQVLNADSGQPIQNFEVKAGSFSPSSYNDGFTTVSDPGGRFRLDDIPVFDQQHLERVTARAEGFAVGSVPAGVVRENETISGVIVRLQPEASVKGIVINAAGGPVGDARVYANYLPNAWDRRDRGVLTDSEGRFTLTGLGSDTTMLHAWHQAYAPGSTGVALRSGRVSQVEIVLPHGGVLQGRVTLNGEGLSTHIETVINGIGASVNSTSDGRYRFEGLPAGAGTVHAAFGNFTGGLNQRREFSVAAGEVVEIDFAFHTANAIIEGVVTLDGEPVEGHVVAVSEQLPEQVMATSLRNGEFRIEQLAEGAVLVSVVGTSTTGASVSPRRTVTAVNGESAWVEFHLTSAAGLYGTVAGAPANHITHVLVLDANAARPETFAEFQRLYDCCSLGRTEGHDQFEFVGIAPGDYMLFAVATPENVGLSEAWEHGLYAWESVSVEAGRRTEIGIGFQ